MDILKFEQEKLSRKADLTQTIADVQKSLDLLTTARHTIANDPPSASMTLAKLQNPVKQSFDAIHNDLKHIYDGLGKYQKALEKHTKTALVPASDHDVLRTQRNSLHRAIAIHLLREGQFSVASTFLSEACSGSPERPPPGPRDSRMDGSYDLSILMSSESLHLHFAEMYNILHAIQQTCDLLPAIAWAKQHRDMLEARGSNLEFELGRLQFIWLFTGGHTGDSNAGMFNALRYARKEFGCFQGRYFREIKQLCGAMAYKPNLPRSPYKHLFHDPSAWEDVSKSFTREFCSVLGLSADSPLYLAATAGAIALPTLLKMASIMKEKKTEWTSENELPVEIPLPPGFHFHSIFVCPVSKEQSTEQNPPMMLPCCHVIAQESLMRISKGTRFKCPYCPCESHPREAMRVYL
ncbi:MAG: hypothetical protein M1826_005167 [Phylliscum demangeonii]|nr:MAG: hypothetical protein M1826_005167 [Phylliscum demangeonii]